MTTTWYCVVRGSRDEPLVIHCSQYVLTELQRDEETRRGSRIYRVRAFDVEQAARYAEELSRSGIDSDIVEVIK